VKQPRGALANSATSTEVVEGRLPISFGEVVRKASFSCQSVLGVDAVSNKVLLAVLASPLLCLWLSVLDTASNPLLPAVIAVVAAHGSLSPFRMLFVVLLLPLEQTISVVLVMTFAVVCVACLAVAIETIGSTLVAVKVLAGGRQPLIAAAATLHRCIAVCGHKVFSYWSYLLRGCGQVVGLTFRGVDQTLLAHASIIPETKGCGQWM
jgi:hypothetical protein